MSRNQAVLWLAIACYAFSPKFVFAGENHKDERAKLAQYFRDFEKLVAHETDAGSRSWRLVSIVNSQLRIKDLPGALRSINSLTEEHREWFDIALLASLQAEEGQYGAAMKTAAKQKDNPASFLAVAQVAHKAVRKTEANNAIAAALDVAQKIENKQQRFRAFTAIADAFMSMKAPDEVRELVTPMMAMVELLKDDPAARGHQLNQLAELHVKIGDKKEARKLIEQAFTASALKSSSNARRDLAVALAVIDDIEGAFGVALTVEKAPFHAAHRDAALHEIAKIQLRNDDLAGAEITLKRIRSFPGYYDNMHVVIAKKRAEIGDLEKAETSAKSIVNQTRKAQGILEVALIIAKRGDKKAARALAEGLSFPNFAPSPLPLEGHFVFNDHKTWGVNYENDGNFTMASAWSMHERVGDLTAAAIRCRIALEGEGGIEYSKIVESWHHYKVAQAQTAAGDPKGVFLWADRLTGQARLDALLGMADGFAEMSGN